MQPSSPQAYPSEPLPTRKNKSQSQRQYRSKETDGFSELRDALLLVDPFETPLGRDATRHQLLITAAKKLRNLADENEKLALQLSAMPTPGLHEPGTGIPHAMVSRNVAVTGVAWPTQEYAVDQFLSMNSKSVPPLRPDYDNIIPGCTPNPPPFYGRGQQPDIMTSGSAYQMAPTADACRYY